ncbi:Uncharacterised protein [Capnocytophaga canimorsus]|nr:hypothetical protein CLV61_0842 [Capnocytophaga canimorsus]STA71852.1 Uncharacterised protein [Capnocytophaga canimorsus]
MIFNVKPSQVEVLMYQSSTLLILTEKSLISVLQLFELLLHFSYSSRRHLIIDVFLMVWITKAL